MAFLLTRINVGAYDTWKPQVFEEAEAVSY
jgi:hypothetical protein